MPIYRRLQQGGAGCGNTQMALLAKTAARVVGTGGWARFGSVRFSSVRLGSARFGLVLARRPRRLAHELSPASRHAAPGQTGQTTALEM